MQQLDYARFSIAMCALGEVFNRELTEPLIQIYFRAMNGLSIEDFERACYSAINECKFFPKPVELREMLDGSRDDQATAAWELACEANYKTGGYQSVYFEDGSIGSAVMTVFQTWHDMAESLTTLSPEMIASKRKEFFSAYRNARRGERRTHYLAGHCEVENKNTVATWKRSTYENCYPMKVLRVAKSDMYFVEVLFDRATAEMIGGMVQLLSAEPVKQIAMPERKQLTDGEGERQYYDVQDEIKRATAMMSLPRERPVMSDEDLEARRATLKDQLEKLKDERL